MPGLKGSEALRTRAHIAHGVVMSTAMVLFFPLGSILLRLLQSSKVEYCRAKAVYVHICCQLLGMVVMLTGFALGCWLSYLHHELWDRQHEIFGTTVFALFLFQPLFGLLHHNHYVKLSLSAPTPSPNTLLERQIRNFRVLIHIWYGRILIILGIINGGLGIKLAANWTNGQMAVYAAIACVIGAVYFVVLGLWYWLLRRQKKVENQEQLNGVETRREK